MKILIANRGEIAVRVIRACRALGLESVAVYSACDRGAPHVAAADEAFPIGSSPPADSYLHVDRILEAARRAEVDAIHPGYGFLSENAGFARACREAGFVFIGPSETVIARMGSKTAARQAARDAGVPVVPGTDAPFAHDVPVSEVARAADALGYPLVVKAVYGGGGKGMRAVTMPAELADAVARARSEALTSFGESSIYLERRFERPRHIEIQILGDVTGRVLPFVERECSVQRRYQKVLEESPSVVVGPDLRESLASAAVALAVAVGYTNAGTVEFLLDEDGRFYFLEMNTRLQVEHPVTELVTGIDIVAWQLRLARGEALDLDASRLLNPLGHAIECRIYAEDPRTGFLPSPGRIASLRTPGGPGIRDDSGVAPGYEVPIFYDSLMSKLLAWGENREQALARLRGALREYDVRGIRTTIPFFQWLVEQRRFLDGQVDTTFLDGVLAAAGGQAVLALPPEAEELVGVGVAVEAFLELEAATGTAAGGGNLPDAWSRAGRLEGLRPC